MSCLLNGRNWAERLPAANTFGPRDNSLYREDTRAQRGQSPARWYCLPWGRSLEARELALPGEVWAHRALGGGSGRGSGAGPRRPTLETQGLDLTWKAQHREYKKDRNRQNQIVVRQMPRKAKKPSFLKSGWQSPLGVGVGARRRLGLEGAPGMVGGLWGLETFP